MLAVVSKETEYDSRLTVNELTNVQYDKGKKLVFCSWVNDISCKFRKREIIMQQILNTTCFRLPYLTFTITDGDTEVHFKKPSPKCIGNSNGGLISAECENLFKSSNTA